MASDVLDQISRLRIVPVIEIPDPTYAAPLGAALLAGGLPCAEVTFRTASAAESISRLLEACPDTLVGAGTVLSREQVDAALDAGASFMVAPGLNPRVVEYALSRGATMVPGVCTPTRDLITLRTLESWSCPSLGFSWAGFRGREIEQLVHAGNRSCERPSWESPSAKDSQPLSPDPPIARPDSAVGTRKQVPF